MSRQHLEMAIKSFDDQEDQLRIANHDIERYRTENKTLLSEVAASAAEVEELRAKLKHVESVMAARVVAAACDIVEENSRKALEAVRDKIKDKFKDLFEEPVKPAAERVKEAAEEVKKLDQQEYSQEAHNRAAEMGVELDPYAPKQHRAKLVTSTAVAPPKFIAEGQNKRPFMLPRDSVGRRIVLLLFGG